MSGPPKEPPRPGGDRERGGQSLDGSSAKIEGQDFEASTIRTCAGCYCLVTDSNLGGHDGKNLSGQIRCESCADPVIAPFSQTALSEAEERHALNEMLDLAALQAKKNDEAEADAIVAAKFAEINHIAVLGQRVCDIATELDQPTTPQTYPLLQKLLRTVRECARDTEVIVDWFVWVETSSQSDQAQQS